jgi:hypothetical protein
MSRVLNGEALGAKKHRHCILTAARELGVSPAAALVEWDPNDVDEYQTYGVPR